MDKRAERLECAWLLREAAWALKRYADRIETACCAVTSEKAAKAEVAAQTWAARARERLAKFTAARRKYLRLSHGAEINALLSSLFADVRPQPIYLNGRPANGTDIPNGADVEMEYRDGAMNITRIGNPWRAGSPPMGADAILFYGPGAPMWRCRVWGVTRDMMFAEPQAWRPA